MTLEKEIAAYQKLIKERKTKMKELSVQLISVMKSNQIECFDINGGSLVYKRNKSKKAINGKSLLAILHEYYKDSNEAQNVAKFIMENREEVYTEVIKHKMDK